MHINAIFLVVFIKMVADVFSIIFRKWRSRTPERSFIRVKGGNGSYIFTTMNISLILAALLVSTMAGTSLNPVYD